jgi:AhpD family alkylhydroperoxidase
VELVELAVRCIEPEDATGEAAELLALARLELGLTPNLTKALANSPAALEGYLGLTRALRGGVLPVGTRERIALLVAQESGSDYGLSAHTFIGTRVAGLDHTEVASARWGRATGAPDAAALALVAALVRGRGAIGDEELAAIRRTGLTDGQLAEVVAHVALGVLTTGFADVARIAVDWPRAHARRK